MKEFLVQVQANLPYPVAWEFQGPASSFGTAINRCIREFRKEVGRKRIKELKVKATLLGRANA